MSLYLFDTDSLTHYFNQNSEILQQTILHLGNSLGTTIISIEEIVQGWLTSVKKAKNVEQVAIGYDRLTKSLNLLQSWPIHSFSLPAIQQYEVLKKMKLNVGKNDLRIGAIAIHLNAVVVTLNGQDFSRIPGLRWEDWTKDNKIPP